MGRRKLSAEVGHVHVIMLLDDEAQRYANEQLDLMKTQGTFQAFMRNLIISAFPIKSQSVTKKEIVSDKKTDAQKPVENLPIESSVDKPATTRFSPPTIGYKPASGNPVNKPGGKS